MLLESKVALITGNATEIGQATARAMSEAGAKVAIGDRDQQGWESTIAAIQALGADVLFHATDITVAKMVRALIERTVNTFGKLDVAFNNTCVNTPATLLADQSESDVVCMIDTNLNGLWLCLKYEIEQMLKGKGGAIVNNSSIFGLRGYAGGAIYVSTEHGITGLTKAVALDYARQGIRINAVAASLIAPVFCEFNGLKTNASHQPLIVPMGRAVRAEEVANAIVWLCSDRASFITGHTLPVDGGFTAQ